MKRRTAFLLILGLLTVASRDFIIRLPVLHSVFVWAGGEKSVDDRVAQYGSLARSRLAPFFQSERASYPPSRITLAYFKKERRLDLYAAEEAGPWRYIRSYRSTAASGVLGPKLREGDLQVPEGIYKVSFLNANSRFHLSLRVNYPNEYDAARGKEDGRKQLGGDIMIHGNAVSIGCIAVGDEPAEDLFVLAADVGIRRSRVVISPVDFRVGKLPEDFRPPTAWTADLYERIQRELKSLPPQAAPRHNRP